MKPDRDTLNSATWSCPFALFCKSGTFLVLVDPAEDTLCYCGQVEQVAGGVSDVDVYPTVLVQRDVEFRRTGVCGLRMD